MNIVIAAPASCRNNSGHCFNQCESKVCYFSWGIEGDSWLIIWLALSCNSQSYDDLKSVLSSTQWYRPFQFVEAWKSSVEGVICKSRLQQKVHTVEFTKLANMITLKRSLIAQSQKLVTAYTRSRVRIVSCNFSDSYNNERNTTMNVNMRQKHGPILYYITQAKSRITKITVMHRTLTHFNSKSVKNLYFCIYFQCEKLTGNQIFLS